MTKNEDFLCEVFDTVVKDFPELTPYLIRITIKARDKTTMDERDKIYLAFAAWLFTVLKGARHGFGVLYYHKQCNDLVDFYDVRDKVNKMIQIADRISTPEKWTIEKIEKIVNEILNDKP